MIKRKPGVKQLQIKQHKEVHWQYRDQVIVPSPWKMAPEHNGGGIGSEWTGLHADTVVG